MAKVVTCRLNIEGMCSQSPPVHVTDESLGTVPWPQDQQLLRQNLARYKVHLAPERSLCVSMIQSYLAGIRLELLDRGLEPKMVASAQLRVLLMAIEWDIGKSQHDKHLVTTMLCASSHASFKQLQPKCA